MARNGGYGAFVYTVAALACAGYFAFSAVQGDLGVLHRLEVQAEIAALQATRDAVAADVEDLRNLTHRLSDGYLDLDLLDERARAMLGYMRADELTVR